MLYLVHAFAEKPGQGNKAGVVLLNTDSGMSPQQMQLMAFEAGYSETAFVTKMGEEDFKIRFYTPTEEIALCGHASIAAAALLKKKGLLTKDHCVLHTLHERVDILIEGDLFWLKIGEPVIKYELSDSYVAALCRAYGLEPSDLPEGLRPAVVDVGIPDIQFPVKSHEALMKAVQNTEAVNDITTRLDTVGVHMFYVPGYEGKSDSCSEPVPEQEPTGDCCGSAALGQDNIRAYCSNYAPRYGIDEESATGTANAGLTYYLYRKNIIRPGETNCILQGEHMGNPSKVYSKVDTAGPSGSVTIRIGGRAIVEEDL